MVHWSTTKDSTIPILQTRKLNLAYSRWMVSVWCSLCSLDVPLLIILQEMQRACLWDILPLELLSLLNSVHDGYTEQELHRGPWFFMNNAENARALYTSLFLLSPPQYLCEVWAGSFFFFFSPAAGAFPCTITLEMVTVTCQESHTHSLVTEPEYTRRVIYSLVKAWEPQRKKSLSELHSQLEAHKLLKV